MTNPIRTNTEDVSNSLKLDELIELRKTLHAYPEVSQHEYETQKRIREQLEKYAPDKLLRIANTGLLAIYEGEKSGKTIMLRADTDALPIQEINAFEYRSKNEGVSHKCGHDGHSTILCGLAQLLYYQRPASGRVALLFQPAEENGWGAQAALTDPAFQEIQPDTVIALHNLPGYPLGEIVVREGAFTAAATSIIIKLQGKTAHAAEPENGLNPALAMSEIIQMMERIHQPDITQEDFALVTPIHFRMGEKAYGVSAGEAELHFTFRSWNNWRMDLLCEQAVKNIQSIAHKHQLQLTIDWTETFRANQNDSKVVQMIREAAGQLELKLTERPMPFKFGEDFGLFTEKYKGAMFGIGAGMDSPALHNPDYDFPDELIEPAVKMFHCLLKENLSS